MTVHDAPYRMLTFSSRHNRVLSVSFYGRASLLAPGRSVVIMKNEVLARVRDSIRLQKLSKQLCGNCRLSCLAQF